MLITNCWVLVFILITFQFKAEKRRGQDRTVAAEPDGLSRHTRAGREMINRWGMIVTK